MAQSRTIHLLDNDGERDGRWYAEGMPWADVRKKPVVVQACLMHLPFEVETLEGVMHGNKGDWLIQGVAGELYPCKNDIFVRTYELVLSDEEKK